AQTDGVRVWAFLGDGECDEPETLGCIGVAGREKLDNLTWVINCNLQRLDGPVRGNGKIIQELEGIFRGAGWNVIKVIWGSDWDELLRHDHTGALAKRMMEVVDGEYQEYVGRDMRTPEEVRNNKLIPASGARRSAGRSRSATPSSTRAPRPSPRRSRGRSRRRPPARANRRRWPGSSSWASSCATRTSGS